MSREHYTSKEVRDKRHLYIAGYILSLVLTIAAYAISVNNVVASLPLFIAVIMGLAGIQMVVQLIFFLHINHEKKPRLNLFVMLFTALVIITVIVGSLWIMINLNYLHHHGQELSPDQTNQYIQKDESIYK